MTSSTMTRLWLSAVVCRRSSASVAQATAESKPNVMVVAARSLSIVLGTPTMGMPASCICCAMVSEPSPPTATNAVMPSASMPRLVASSNSLGSWRTSPWPVLAENWPRLAVPENGAAAHQQAVERLVIQHAKILRRQQAVVTADDADGFPTAFGGGFGNRADDRVQAGTIPAAGNDADFHSKDHYTIGRLPGCSIGKWT